MLKDMSMYIHTRYQEQEYSNFSVSSVFFEVVEGNCSQSDQTENYSFYKKKKMMMMVMMLMMMMKKKKKNKKKKLTTDVFYLR